jgi:hypothetical protein
VKEVGDLIYHGLIGKKIDSVEVLNNKFIATDDNVEPASSYNLPNNGRSVSFSPDGQYIAVGHNGSPYFTLLKAGGIFKSQPPVIVEFMGRKYRLTN